MLKLLTIAAFCVILNTDDSLESREQTLFFRNKLSASYPADVILQQKQMEAALVSFNDSAFVNRAEGLSKLFFKFDKLAHLATLAIASDATSFRSGTVL